MYQLTHSNGCYSLRFCSDDPERIKMVERIFRSEMSRCLSSLSPTLVKEEREIKVSFAVDNQALLRYYCNEFGMRHMVTVEMK